MAIGNTPWTGAAALFCFKSVMAMVVMVVVDTMVLSVCSVQQQQRDEK